MNYRSLLLPALISVALTGCSSNIRISGTVLHDSHCYRSLHNPHRSGDGFPRYQVPVRCEDNKIRFYYFYLDDMHIGGIPPPNFYEGEKIDLTLKKENVIVAVPKIH